MKTKPFSQKRAKPAAMKQQNGIVLLEAMVAILIFSVGILGVIGLQAAMIKNTAQANYRATANFIAQEMVGDMWADPANIANHYVRVCNDLLPNGVCTAAAGARPAGQVVVTIVWQPPGDVLHNYVLLATVAGGTA